MVDNSLANGVLVRETIIGEHKVGAPASVESKPRARNLNTLKESLRDVVTYAFGNSCLMWPGSWPS